MITCLIKLPFNRVTQPRHLQIFSLAMQHGSAEHTTQCPFMDSLVTIWTLLDKPTISLARTPMAPTNGSGGNGKTSPVHCPRPEEKRLIGAMQDITFGSRETVDARFALLNYSDTIDMTDNLPTF